MPPYPRLSVPRFNGRGRGPLVRLLPALLPACVPISFESPPVPPESLGPSVRPSVPTPSPRPPLPDLRQSFTLRMPLRPTPIPRRPLDLVLRDAPPASARRPSPVPPPLLFYSAAQTRRSAGPRLPALDPSPARAVPPPRPISFQSLCLSVCLSICLPAGRGSSPSPSPSRLAL